MTTTTFAELGLSHKVLAAIEAAGYVTPTPIQADAIPVALTGRDILGIAQTGTGKTAAFTMPMISRLETGRARARMPRSLILAPTRELAAQVAQSFEKYGTNHKLTVALLIGGVSMDDQVKKLDRGVDVLIATPGRLIDHFNRGRVMLMGVEILVIDEADRMLDMGFIPDIEKICRLLPPRRQTLFFSATMPPEITRLADQFLKEPTRIEVARPATTAKTITQLFRFCPEGEDWAKREELRELIRNEENFKNAIVFCNRKRDVAILLKSLTKHGFNAGALHGDMDQKSRMETLDQFRSGEIIILAASDVAARGLDIPDVSHVFNFDLPWQSDDYVHRIGRTGRAGKSGIAYSLVTIDDLKLLNDIAKITGDETEWIGEPPSEEEIASAGKRRRGRGGRSARSGDRKVRGGERGERGRRSSRDRTEPTSERRSKSTAARRSDDAPPLPGTGEQPDVLFEPAGVPVPMAANPDTGDVAPAHDEQPKRRRRGGRTRGRAQQGIEENLSDGAAEASDQQPSQVAHSRTAGDTDADDAGERDAQPTRRRRTRQTSKEGGEPVQESRSRGSSNGGARRKAPTRQRSSGEQREHETAPATTGAAKGFADNVPAFLRRPLPKRRQKVASE
ncbi:MAG: DEAD/DEAH box helicase [Hyphomicrobiaceae bacterium]